MPSKLRRINLTVPDDMYAAIALYADENGIQANSVACMSLIQRALASYKEGQHFDFCKIENVARECDRLSGLCTILEQRYVGLYGLYLEILARLSEM